MPGSRAGIPAGPGAPALATDRRVCSSPFSFRGRGCDVCPQLPGLRRREAVETGPHLQIELRADGPHRFGTERVAAEPDDPSVLLLEPEYLLEGFSPAACAEPERERLALEQSALEPRRLVRELRRPLRVAVDGVVEPASNGCERTAVDAGADVHHPSSGQPPSDEDRAAE